MGDIFADDDDVKHLSINNLTIDYVYASLEFCKNQHIYVPSGEFYSICEKGSINELKKLLHKKKYISDITFNQGFVCAFDKCNIPIIDEFVKCGKDKLGFYYFRVFENALRNKNANVIESLVKVHEIAE